MENIFKSNYNRQNWINFLKNKFLPGDFSLRREQIDIDFKSKYIKPQAYWIGDCESLGDLAIIEISHSSEQDPRIGVSRDAFRLMAEYGLSKALFFFVSDNSNNYRFSLITLDLKLEGTGVKYKFSNPKRFSFFLGEEAKIHTPEEFLIRKGRIKDFEDLKNRFSIEVVNKEFYNNIQRLFYKLVGGKVKQSSKKLDFAPMLKLPSTQDHKTMQEFGVRLIGRLVFCWFLKKKKSDAGIPLIPKKILSSDAVKENYYHNTIEPLFFELLNTPINIRRDDFRSTEYDLIPFLNGGLFDPNLHEDYYRYSPMEKEYKPSYNLVIPDEWLEEFIALLETYNFTIDENTSVDIDLSVDPEMLGRIFENLLAEINPETGNTARKATGSYYTPRPIVEYMVDESLIQYLLTKTDIEETAIRELLDYNIEVTELSKEKKIAVIDALDEIKVLDPACGSGAFPMGILQKMLLILQKVDPESIEWVIRQLDKIPNKLVRKALEDKLMNENWKYKHKMGIVQNAIYGVDIQPIATEISKLRLFLTLIVDENILDDKPNRNIHTLPNLSFKFVTANTLIGLPEAKVDDQMDLMDFDTVLDPMMDTLENLREEFFYASGMEKQKVEEEFLKVQRDISTFLTSSKSTNRRALALTNWNPFEDKASGWFDPNWMFGIESGFDIVIGNPPFIQGNLSNDLLQLYKKLYKTAEYKGNTYNLFFEKGIKLLKESSIISYITPISYLKNKHSKNLRKLLSVNNLIFKLIDFDFYVFENVSEDMLITLAKHIEKKEDYSFDTFHCENLKNLENSICTINSNTITGPLYNICIDLNEKDIVLLSKIKINSFPLSKYAKMYFGIQTKNRKKYVTSKSINSASKPVIDGSNLMRYNYKPHTEYVTFEPAAIKSGGNRLVYKKNRLATPQIGVYPVFAFIPKNLYTLNTIYNIYLEEGLADDYLLFLLGLLNSKVSQFFWKKNFYDNKPTFPKIKKDFLKAMPIPKFTENVFTKVVFIVKQILSNKNFEKETQILENQIDLMVYKLYELTYEEVKIVDPEFDKVLAEFGLSKENYERMSVEGFACLAVE